MRHLLHIFPTFGVGGVSVRMARIFGRLGGEFRHTVVALDDCFSCQSRFEKGLDVRLLRLSNRPRHLVTRLARIRRVLLDNSPDLLMTYNWGAIEWAFVNRIINVCPLVHLESGFGKEEAETLLARRTLVRRIVLPGARFVVVPSRTLAQIAEGVWHLKAEHVVHIPNGVDCSKFAIDRAPHFVKEIERRSGEVLIGTVAPLRPEKNLSRLIRAFAVVASRVRARLLIVGDGPERATLADLARELGLADRVVFAGHVEAVERVLATFDVFALSSDTEQMPNSVLQAMAAAKPVAALDVGDIKINVSPRNSIYISPRGNEGAFQDLLERLATSSQLRDELGRANREHVRAHYTEDRMVAAYREVLTAACRGCG